MQIYAMSVKCGRKINCKTDETHSVESHIFCLNALISESSSALSFRRRFPGCPPLAPICLKDVRHVSEARTTQQDSVLLDPDTIQLT